MTFKAKWEKASTQVTLPASTLKAMIRQAFPDKQILSYELVLGGCANLNIKFTLLNDVLTHILRVYLRDKDAAYREQKLAVLLNQSVPIPQVYFVGDYDSYRFAITEYLPGITLRDLLLSNDPHDVKDIMFDVGLLFSEIQSHHFSSAGFFDRNLNIVEKISQESFFNFAMESLKHPTVLNCLSNDVLIKINNHLNKYKALFPGECENHLVHADFDPANILVDKKQGKWKITGILDWEFSFSGSPLCDIANMLRYAHEMPTVFELSFLQGLKTGFTLPPSWRISMHLLNLLSLLDCLVRCPTDKRPNQCTDICALINHITLQLDTPS